MSDVDFKDVATVAGIAALAVGTGGLALGAGVPAAGLGSAVGATGTAGAVKTGAGAALAGAKGLGSAIVSNPLQAGLTAATVGSGASSVVQQREAAQQQRRSNAARQRISEIRNRRARLATLEQSRVAQAEAQQVGANVGAGQGSTSIRGRVASLRARAGGNIGAQLEQQAAENSIFNAEQEASRASNRAQLFGEASSLAAQVGGTAPIRTLFD